MGLDRTGNNVKVPVSIATVLALGIVGLFWRYIDSKFEDIHEDITELKAADKALWRYRGGTNE